MTSVPRWSCLLLLACLGLTLWNERALAAQRPARNVILIVVDGMSLANEVAASWYTNGPAQERSLSFHHWPGQALLSTWDITTWLDYAPRGSRFDVADFDPRFGYDPQRGGLIPLLHPDAEGREDYFLTRPQAEADGELKQAAQPSTDSASSATAYATGRKVRSGIISWDEEADTALETIGQRLRRERSGRAGYGVVSTVPFNHATPAAFCAHDAKRSHYVAIAQDIIDNPPDVVIGGGHPRWRALARDGALKPYLSLAQLAALRSDPRFEFVEREPGADGAELLQEAAQQARANGRVLFGLFGGPEGCMNEPRATGNALEPWNMGSVENPDCAELALAALELLSDPQRFPDGFFLMVEQGDVDWAGHAGEWDWMLGAMHDADECARRIAQWLAQGHGTANADNTLVLLVPDHSHYVRLAASYSRQQFFLPPGSGRRPERKRSDPYWRRYLPWGSVVWSGPLYHSNELVTLYALGAGARPGGAAALLDPWRGKTYGGGTSGLPSAIDNTAVYHIMADWLGLAADEASWP